MKRSYYLIAAVGLTAVIVGYRLCRHQDKPAPSLPMPVEATRDEPNSLPPLPTIPEAPPLPMIVSPADAPLVIPATSPLTPSPDVVTVTPATDVPIIPAIPLPGSSPEAIPLGGVADAPQVPAVPGTTTPSGIVQNPVIPPAPPVPLQPLVAATPLNALPAAPDGSLKPASRFLVLRGKPGPTTPANQLIVELMACKLMAIEGVLGEAKGNVKVQQWAIERSVSRADVVFAGETLDEVYHYMRDKAPAADAITRLVVARWCMLHGLREQALAESREILKLQPGNKSAAEIARSLEESLKQFPMDGSGGVRQAATKMVAVVAEPDMEIPPEAATTFSMRVQPILANLCVDCHARADYTGSFKMARVSGDEGGPQATQLNLRATVAQLSKTDPVNSPLLVKAVTAHGGLKQPPFVSRQAPGYRAIESWASLALTYAMPRAASATPVTQTSTPAAPPPAAPTSGLPAVPQPVGLPAVPVSLPTTPTVPSAPAIPVAPPAVSVPLVLPTPPTMTPAVPSQPPVVPPPVATPIPPRSPMGSVPALPSVPSPVKQTSGVSPNGSQFGTNAQPRPLPPSVTGNGDEFDPSGFNKGK